MTKPRLCWGHQPEVWEFYAPTPGDLMKRVGRWLERKPYKSFISFDMRFAIDNDPKDAWEATLVVDR